MSQLQPPSLSTDHSFGENTVCRRYGFANRTANGLIRAEENSFGLMSEVESQDGLSFPVEIIEFGSHRQRECLIKRTVNEICGKRCILL